MKYIAVIIDLIAIFCYGVSVYTGGYISYLYFAHGNLTNGIGYGFISSIVIYFLIGQLKHTIKFIREA